MLEKLFFIALALNMALPFSQAFAQEAETGALYDLLITNARVVDGTGNPWFRADVAIRDGRIARVGRIETGAAKQTIDAQNKILAPGFVDVHAHVEGIFNTPQAENFVRMGVTSLVTGNCGGSVTNVGEFLNRFQEKPLAVNLATLIAHGSVRRAIMGSDNREPTSAELERMQALVEKAMREGAVGFSTGLIYVPGTYAKTDEIIALAKVAAAHNGIYATHMRNEGGGVLAAIQESIEIGEKAGLPVQISHFKIASKNLWGQSSTTLGLVKAARERGLQVTVDQYAYTASSTSLNVLLPSWALAGGLDEGKKRLADTATRAKIAEQMKQGLLAGNREDYSYAVVANYRTNPAYNGRNIQEITLLAQGKDDLEAQVEQILTMYQAGGAQMIYHVMNEDDLQNIMREPFTMIAADSGLPQLGVASPHPRGYGNNARVLGRYTRDLRVLTLEDAVRKMTSLPAQTFGLNGRGLIRENFAADLVLFDDKTIADQATFENPHQYPVGISHVFVNGTAVLADGERTDARPGVALRRDAR